MSRGVIGTAGHIDHGKTALVAALTGEDTDRLPEEKARGISIDLGFSHLDLDGQPSGVVDVPGHEDFIRNMLAGATGVDVLLLVVAADEGVMPQTREHVAIAQLLGVPRAVVALTKADLVDAELLELAREDVRDFLADTAYADAPLIPTAAPTGQGIDALRSALAEAARVTRRRIDDLFRLPVDRVFTVRGTGTVATGTVWSGSLEADGAVRVLPEGVEARVRGLQVHGSPAARVEAGQRAAVALTGVERAALTRGATLVTVGTWTPSTMLTTRLQVIPGSQWRVRQRQRVRVHLGTAEVMARVRLLEGSGLEPGQEAWAQLRLESPLVARAGDRLVIRSYSPVTTIGGGIVAEAGTVKRKRLPPPVAERLETLATGSADAAVAARVEEAGIAGVATDRLPLETLATPAEAEAALTGIGAVVEGACAFPAGALEGVRTGLLEQVSAFHARHPLRPGMDLEELRRSQGRANPVLVERALRVLIEADELTTADGRVAAVGFAPKLTPEQRSVRDGILGALEAAGPEPPALDELAERLGRPASMEPLLRLLELDGKVVRLGGGSLYLHAATAESIAAEVSRRLGGRSGLGPADFRDVLPVSRKYLIPILEHLDARGITVRQGGARAVAASASQARSLQRPDPHQGA